MLLFQAYVYYFRPEDYPLAFLVREINLLNFSSASAFSVNKFGWARELSWYSIA